MFRSTIRLQSKFRPKKSTPPLQTPPTAVPPPRPPQKPITTTLHNLPYTDPYAWMSNLSDSTSMRHMDIHVSQEMNYTDSVMTSANADKLVRKLQIEMATRMAVDVCTPPVKWGPWIYYRRVEEGKQYGVLCRRLEELNREFVSYSEISAGFDFGAGKRIEQKLVDYNLEAERFGGYAYEEQSDISPDHRFLAYTMYDKDKDCFILSVRDLTTGALCEKPRIDFVANLAWAMNGKALLYTVTNSDKRPFRIFCSMLGSTKDDTLIMEDSNENVYLNIRSTKDFQFITVYIFSSEYSKVYLIDAADPLSKMMLVWEGQPQAHCIVEHHQGYFYLFTDAPKGGVSVDSHYLKRCAIEDVSLQKWEDVFIEEPGITLEDVDFCNTHMVLVLKENKKFKICSIDLPLPENGKGAMRLSSFHPCFLPLPKHVCQISSGPNYDYYSSIMRFVISSPVMPDATVDYNLTTGKWQIVQQQNVLHERTRILYGTSSTNVKDKSRPSRSFGHTFESENSSSLWNELSEYYACEHYDVPSDDNVNIPLTIVCSHKHKEGGSNPGLLHGHGAYGELLDMRWKSELKSLLDRGWVIAYAGVRGGGGMGKKWHNEGKRMKKMNSILDYISCAEFLKERGMVHENKLAGWGYSVGGLLVASAINHRPNLFRAAVLKVPFLDPCNTLLQPILPLTPMDYEEFGYPVDQQEFQNIMKYSPYENIQKDVAYPAIMVTSSLNTRFGVWEAVKWVARVRDLTIQDPKCPVVLNLSTDIVEENKYLETKELATETAFLIKMMSDT